MATMERLDCHGLLHRERYRRFCSEHMCHSDLCWDSRHGLEPLDDLVRTVCNCCGLPQHQSWWRRAIAKMRGDR